VTSPTPAPVANLANWQDPPHNRWGFQHVRELIPTARIERSPDPRSLPAGEPIDLAALALPAPGPRTAEQALAETWTSGFLVLHDGRVRAESYRQGLTPSRPHLLMSVSKSMVATVAGILAGRGALAPETPVVEVLPELRGTDWEGAAVRHLLDMRAGTRFDEDYANVDADVRVYEQVYLWRPRTTPGLPEDGHAYMAGLRNKRPHGGPFDYRSILTDVLGWVLERVAGVPLAELLERELWGPMGAEFDADVTVDARGNALADGGICCTLRDLGRFGQLWLDGGAVDGRQVIPEAWIRDTLEGGPDSREAFLAGGQRTYRGGFYRNKLWILDPELPLFAGFGINGQAVFVHVPARLVVAKLSTWPTALDDAFERSALAVVNALAEAVG
jgi:CubicO group peptidase (beta-lactamase class C family)